MKNEKITLVELYQAKGLLFPTNAEEVREFEKQNNLLSTIPKDWDNPLAILFRGKQILDNINLNSNYILQEDIENLSMAAREGNIINEDVRKKMNEDKNNAKNK